MYGVFVRGIDGMDWISNHDTIEQANVVANETAASGRWDFVFVMPVTTFIDVDGAKAD